MKTDWNPVLRAEFDKPYWVDLQRFVADERARHAVFPPVDQVFAALHLTPYETTRVVLLGQDPYHGRGQAHGLCFSVRDGVDLPPSLVNIYAELRDDLHIETPHRVVFILWGAHARKKKALIDTSRHTIIESAHPSPLSARNGFFGSKPFSRANAALVEAGLDPIDWRLPA